MNNVLIIGAGPAGLFCAEELLALGHRSDSIRIIDSGKSMHERGCIESPDCDCSVCDILEGVGGAGGFSDGKMTLSLDRGVQTESVFRNESKFILDRIDQKMVEYGGEGRFYEPIAQDKKSDFQHAVESAGFKFDTYALRHLGSDGAQRMIEHQERSLRDRGVEFILNTKVIDLVWWEVNSKKRIIGVEIASSGRLLFADTIVIATGLQGEPWVARQARELGIQLLDGPAGIGIRLETSADKLKPLFDTFYDFKMELETPIGQLRSFCCNREGYIVNENHHELVIRNVNGHSNLSQRLKSKSSNFAIIAKIDDWNAEDRSSQAWVKCVARSINRLVGGMTVVQDAVDFMNGIPSESSKINSNPVRTNLQAMSDVDMSRVMPRDLRESFYKFLMTLDDVLPNGIGEDAVVYGPEIKYYGRRFPVDESWKSINVNGLYVIGNASGYIDSYVAAAASGVIAAKDIMKG